MSRRTQDPTRLSSDFMYGACTLCGWPFNAIPLSSDIASLWSYYPKIFLVWAPPISLAATLGITVVFFSSGYLDVSVPRVALSWPMYSAMDDISLDMPDSSIRIPTDLCARTTPRRVSPFDASFFSSMCLGIHHTPFLT